jgi:hypothetical protein
MKMGTLTSKLVPLGWTIPVVPELESLTIGMFLVYLIIPCFR